MKFLNRFGELTKIRCIFDGQDNGRSVDERRRAIQTGKRRAGGYRRRIASDVDESVVNDHHAGNFPPATSLGYKLAYNRATMAPTERPANT
jgi:hypothetical protein